MEAPVPAQGQIAKPPSAGAAGRGPRPLRMLLEEQHRTLGAADSSLAPSGRLSGVTGTPQGALERASSIRSKASTGAPTQPQPRPLLGVLRSAIHFAERYDEYHVAPNDAELAAALQLFQQLFPQQAAALRRLEAPSPRSTAIPEAIEALADVGDWTQAPLTEYEQLLEFTGRLGARVAAELQKAFPEGAVKCSLWISPAEAPSMLIADASDDGGWVPMAQRRQFPQALAGTASRTPSRLLLPVALPEEGGRVGAVVELSSESSMTGSNLNSLTEAHESLLKTVTARLQRTLVTFENHRQAAVAQRLQAALLELANSSPGTFVDCLEIIRAAALRVFDAEEALVADSTRDGRWGLSLRRIAAAIEASDVPMVIADTLHDPRFVFDDAFVARSRSLLAVRIAASGSQQLVLILLNKAPIRARSHRAPARFSETDLVHIPAFQAQCEAMLAAWKVREEVRQQLDAEKRLVAAVAHIHESDLGELGGILDGALLGLVELQPSGMQHPGGEYAAAWVAGAESLSCHAIRHYLPPTKTIRPVEPPATVALTADFDQLSEPRWYTPSGELSPPLASILGRLLGPDASATEREREQEREALVVPVRFDSKLVGILVWWGERVSDHSKPSIEAVGITRLLSWLQLTLRNWSMLRFAAAAAEEAVLLHRSGVSDGAPPTSGATGGLGLSHHITVNPADVERLLHMPVPSSTMDVARTTAFSPHLFATLDEALRAVLRLLLETGLPQQFGCSDATLCQYLLACQGQYRAVPYHSFYHALDVAQTVWYYLQNGMSQYLRPLEQFVLLITAVAHDLDHTGVNNNFHLKTDSPLGILSSTCGTQSVLEVHHCNVAIAILEHPDRNVFRQLSPGDAATAFKQMIDCILATDMARHAEFLGSVKAATQRVAQGATLDGEADRLLIQQLILKAADVSNVTKAFAVSQDWAARVTEEFYAQGDFERARGVTPLPSFDRRVGTELATGQLGFIRFVAKPFFHAVSELLPPMQWTVASIEAVEREWAAVRSPVSASQQP